MELNSSTKQIEDIDKIISNQLTLLSNMAENLHFMEVCQFELTTNTNAVCNQDHFYPGIYFFEIQNANKSLDAATWFNDFTALWRHPDYHMRWVPGIKKMRVTAHKEVGDWIPLYIGKSKNVGARINEHIIKELAKTTFAMKLKARTNLYGANFRVKALKMDVANYNVVVPHLENLLRNKWNPIVGKQ